MLAIFLTIAGAAAPTAVDAERAFSRDAQTNGQWTASRAYAGHDAVMFTPQAIWAREFLKRTQGSAGGAALVAQRQLCVVRRPDGGQHRPVARRNRQQRGFFTTVWEKEKGRWRWISDGRHSLKAPLPARKSPVVRTASCKGRAPGPPLMAPPSTRKGPGGVTPDDFGRGYSADRTLGWDWRVGPNGARDSGPSCGTGVAIRWR